MGCAPGLWVNKLNRRILNWIISRLSSCYLYFLWLGNRGFTSEARSIIESWTTSSSSVQIKPAEYYIMKTDMALAKSLSWATLLPLRRNWECGDLRPTGEWKPTRVWGAGAVRWGRLQPNASIIGIYSWMERGKKEESTTNRFVMDIAGTYL